MDEHIERDNACALCGFVWPCDASRWQARAAALEADNERLRVYSRLLATHARFLHDTTHHLVWDDCNVPWCEDARALLSSQREPQQQQPGDAAAVRRAADEMEAAITLWLDCSACGEGTGTLTIPMVCESRLEESMHSYREAVGRGAGEATD